MKSHYFDYIEICPPFRHLLIYGLMFWLTQFVQEHASTHNSPASRQEHFLTCTHSLYVQYRWVRSRTSTGVDARVCIVGVTSPSSQADQLWPTGSISSWFGMWLLHQMNIWNLARRICMLVESVFGWGKHCCRLVCCHGNDVAHSLNVSTSLSFFPREYGEAFKELCNSGTNGTEQVGDARSNKDQRDVQDVEECMYAMICSTWVMFGPSNEHNHSSKGINRSWEFYELHPGQKQNYLHWFD